MKFAVAISYINFPRYDRVEVSYDGRTCAYHYIFYKDNVVVAEQGVGAPHHPSLTGIIFIDATDSADAIKKTIESFSKHIDSAIAEAVPEITLTRDEAVHLFNMFRTRELTNLEQELFNRIKKFLEETK